MNFLNSFMLKIIKLIFFHFIKVLKLFSGVDLGASPWNLGFKPWWMHALMYVVCIYIDVSCIHVVYEACVMMVNIFKNVLLKKSKPNTNKNHSMYFCHGMPWKNYNPWLNFICLLCGMLIHVILPWDVILSISNS